MVAREWNNFYNPIFGRLEKWFFYPRCKLSWVYSALWIPFCFFFGVSHDCLGPSSICKHTFGVNSPTFMILITQWRCQQPRCLSLIRLLISIFLTSPLGHTTGTPFSVCAKVNLPCFPDRFPVSSLCWVSSIREWGQQLAVGLASQQEESSSFHIINSCPA